MSKISLEDTLLEAMVGVAQHHGETLERVGNRVQVTGADIGLEFTELNFGERSPGNYVLMAKVRISAPLTELADLYDTLLEGGPDTQTPLEHGAMEAYHLLDFVQKVLLNKAKPDSEFALANAQGTRSFQVYWYGPVVRADTREARDQICARLEGESLFLKVFSGVADAITGYRPYWVKLNHLKLQKTNVPEARLDENEWPQVQAQIATFQWPQGEGLMGYKQFFIFMPAGRQPAAPEKPAKRGWWPFGR